jgi:hypothetical protein
MGETIQHASRYQTSGQAARVPEECDPAWEVRRGGIACRLIDTDDNEENVATDPGGLLI